MIILDFCTSGMYIWTNWKMLIIIVTAKDLLHLYFSKLHNYNFFSKTKTFKQLKNIIYYKDHLLPIYINWPQT